MTSHQYHRSLNDGVAVSCYSQSDVSYFRMSTVIVAWSSGAAVIVSQGSSSPLPRVLTSLSLQKRSSLLKQRLPVNGGSGVGSLAFHQIEMLFSPVTEMSTSPFVACRSHLGSDSFFATGCGEKGQVLVGTDRGSMTIWPREGSALRIGLYLAGAPAIPLTSQHFMAWCLRVGITVGIRLLLSWRQKLFESITSSGNARQQPVSQLWRFRSSA